MKKSHFAVHAALCLSVLAAADRSLADDAAPDNSPAQTPPRETKLKSVTVVYRVVHTTPEAAAADCAKALAAVKDAMKAASLAQAGESVVVTHGPFGHNADTITADVGVIVPDGSKAPGDELIRSMPSTVSFASVYFGPADGLHEAIVQLFTEAHRAGRTPGDEIRQHMLHWEGADSPNNVILLELTLKQ